MMLLGCVRTREQSEWLERAVWLVDDVMGVVNYLKVGEETPRYPVQRKN
jgi:osmotically-inducible protein OsmY